MIPVGNKNSGADLQLPKEEVQQAILVRALDLGSHESTYKGVTSVKRQGALVFELPNDKTEDDSPLLIYFWTGWSMGTDTYPSKLRKTLETITKTKINDKVIGNGFDIASKLGINCYVNIVHRKSPNGKTYANIDSFMPLPNGVPALDSWNEQFEFSIDQDGSFDTGLYEKLSDGLQKKIITSYEVTNAS